MSATATAPVGAFAKASGRRRLRDNRATVLVYASVIIALIPLVWVLWTVISSGVKVLFHAAWWTHTMRNVNYTDPGGGALHAIVGSLEQVAICTVVSVPVAILVGVYLVEYGRGTFARVTTFMVDILTGIPSIVAALFIYTLVVETFNLSRSGWLVSAALIILMVPVIVRATEEMLKLVPNELREASYALGVPKWKTIVKVVIPTASNGLITGIVLGIARVTGETAPLLILVSYSDSMNVNPFSGAQAALPTLIRDQFSNAGQTLQGGGGYHLDPKTGQVIQGSATNYSIDRMWGAALTLILIVLVLTVIARLIGRKNKLAK